MRLCVLWWPSLRRPCEAQSVAPLPNRSCLYARLTRVYLLVRLATRASDGVARRARRSVARSDRHTMLRTETQVHVAFVALYQGDAFVKTIERAAGHLRSGSTLPLQFHAVVNKASPRMPQWCTQHAIGAMPSDAIEQHRNLSKGKPPGAHIFLWKAFLYRLLPMDKLIILDHDVVLTSVGQLQGLWEHFNNFGPETVLGVIREQGPTYLRIARDAGVNGGVQLQHLARMRASASLPIGGVGGALLSASSSSLPASEQGAGISWDSALRRCAAGGCRGWDAVEPSLGDQTLYSSMCRRDPHLCHMLPCGWNRQLSTRYYTVPDFARSWHACDTRCRLLHFNQPLLEQLVPELQLPDQLASCADCRSALLRLENRTRAAKSKNPKFTWGSSKVHMAQVIENCCCSSHSSL